VPNELAAVKRFNVTLLIVVGRAPMGELAHNFVRTLDRIEAMLDEHAPPLIAKVYRPAPSALTDSATGAGRVEVWFPKR
jgi:hypothetical protein